MKYKAILYDMDGVVNRQPEYFSRAYAKEHGVDEGKLETFFDNAFLQCSLGKGDLLDLVVQRNDLWKWNGSPEELLQNWFDFENAPDAALVRIIRAQREAGIKVYLATVQEKYRTAYIREKMFPDLFNDIFATCELGSHKRDAGFFEEVMRRVAVDVPGIEPHEIVYFDDNDEGLITANELGIDTYLYEGVEQVVAVVS